MAYSPEPVDIAFAFLVIAVVYVMRRKARHPLPPGPPGIPFLRNVFDFPQSFDWETYGRWADQFGPIISLEALGTHIIVVNTYKKAIEMLEKKSMKYSSRPYMAMPMDLLGFKESLGFVDYGPRFRKYRRVFHEELGTPTAVRAFWPQEEIFAKSFLRNCLESPEKLAEHCFQLAAAIILQVAYGYRVKGQDDDFVRTGNLAMEAFNEGSTPSKFLVNQLPILRFIPDWFPGAGFQRWANSRRHLYSAMVDTPFNFVKKAIENGTAEDSFTARWLRKQISSDEEAILKHASGAMFGAGGETTALVVQTFFLTMALYPEIQRKAHIEIDAVVGHDRLPSLEERDNLPYIDAIIKELMRFHPPVPSGLPHATSEADIHDKLYIPKGAIVISNIWKMSRDPSVYISPETFNPDRFLGSSPEQDPRDIVFGFGRRLCPGRHLADSSIYITLAMCLAAFEIKVDKNVPPILKGKGGPINHLEPFAVNIKPRIDLTTLTSWLKE